jgi:hypothetical protein
MRIPRLQRLTEPLSFQTLFSSVVNYIKIEELFPNFNVQIGCMDEAQNIK